MTRRQFIASFFALPAALVAAAKCVAKARKIADPGKLIITSTPRGEPSWFYDAWSDHDQDSLRCYFAGFDPGIPGSDKSSMSVWEVRPDRKLRFVREIKEEVQP